MKKSNIILLSIFLTVLVGGTTFLFVAAYEAQQYTSSNTGMHKELYKQNLDSFKSLIIKGKGQIIIIEDTNNNFIESQEKNTFEQRGDTLIIDLKYNSKLHCSNIKSIATENNIKAIIDAISSDTINVYTKSNSYFMTEKIESNYINIESSENSTVRISTITDVEPKASVKFSLSGNAKVIIQDVNNLNMELNKEGNSTFKML